MKTFGKSLWVSLTLVSLLAAGVSLWLMTSKPAPGKRHPSSAPSATVDTVEVFANQIYQTGVSLGRLPYAWARGLIVKWKLREFLNELPIEGDVRTRVLERISTSEFVDEVIPFLFAIKNQYLPSSRDGNIGFDHYLRSIYRQSENLVGFEHSMFSWKEKETSSAFKYDPGMAATALRLYDIVYLQTGGSPLKDEGPVSDDVIQRAMPLVKAFLEHLSSQMEPGSEMAEGIRGMAATDERVETLTLTLVHAISGVAAKNYQLFAQKVLRSRDLSSWLRSELDEPAGGQLWDYLRYALDGRRYGVHIVVDGLQGHLIEGLQKQGDPNPFLKSLVRLHESADQLKPAGVESKPAPEQSIQFLKKTAAEGLHDERYLPYFRKMYSQQNHGIVRFGVSTTPTISVRNLPIAWAGAPVAGSHSTGLPNFHFLDREIDRAYYFFGNDALLLEGLTKKSGMITMFERLPSFVSVNCNAMYDTGTKASYDALLNLALGEKLRDFGDILCYLDLKNRAENEVRLRGWREELLEYEEFFQSASRWDPRRVIYRRRMQQIFDSIAELEDEGLPQYLMYYNPWPDHFAHFTGPFGDEILAPSGELNRLDYWLSKIDEIYSDPRLGVKGRTLFGMAGDHGLTPVFHTLNPEDVIFKKLEAQGSPWVIAKISSDEGEGPKMNHPVRPPSMTGKDVVIASTAGGNYMLDFFKDHGAGWKEQPLYRDLTQLKTLAGHTHNIIEESVTLLGDSLDYLIVREEISSPERATIRAIGPRAGKAATAIIRRQGSRIHYDSAGDLLGLRKASDFMTQPERLEHQQLLSKCIDESRPEDHSSWCDEETWRYLASFTERQDSIAQLAHLYDTDYAGTVNLFPARGVGYNTKVPGRHAGEDFHEKDAFVGFWGDPVQAQQRVRTAINGSVPVTFYEYLTGKTPEGPDQGWGYRSLAEEILRPGLVR